MKARNAVRKLRKPHDGKGKISTALEFFVGGCSSVRNRVSAVLVFFVLSLYFVDALSTPSSVVDGVAEYRFGFLECVLWLIAFLRIVQFAMASAPDYFSNTEKRAENNKICENLRELICNMFADDVPMGDEFRWANGDRVMPDDPQIMGEW